MAAMTIPQASARSDTITELRTSVLWCSPRAFAVAWAILVALQVSVGLGILLDAVASQMALIPLVAVALNALEAIGIPLDRSVMQMHAITALVVALAHLVSVGRAIHASVKTRELTFSVPETDGQLPSSSWLSSCWSRCGAPARMLGVRGRYFEVAFVTREIIEVTTQTYQCYCNSTFVARAWLNQFAVVLLMLNCWSTPCLHWFFRYHRIRIVVERACCLVVDVVLDIMMVALLPVLIGLPYLVLMIRLLKGDSTAANGIADPAWMVQLKSEAQLVAPMTWPALITQALQWLAVLQAVGDIKSLLGRTSALRSQRKGFRIAVAPRPTDRSLPQRQRNTAAPRREKRRPLLLALDFVFGIWGAVILALHTRAFAYQTDSTGGNTRISSCQLQLHPWFADNVTCVVVMIDCHRLGIRGMASDIESVLAPYSLNDTGALTIAHCEALAMPTSLVHMENLLSVEIYNSTLEAWSTDAALRASAHPCVYEVLLYRVNLVAVGNTMPPGLMTTELPSTITILLVRECDLSGLSHDFAKIWQHHMLALILDYCHLPPLAVDVARIPLQHTFSAIGNTQLTEISAAVFHGPVTVTLDGIPGLVLPTNVTTTVTASISIQNSSIASIPEWVLSAGVPTVWAWNSPLCPSNSSSRYDHQTFVCCYRKTMTFDFDAWVVSRGLAISS